MSAASTASCRRGASRRCRTSPADRRSTAIAIAAIRLTTARTCEGRVGADIKMGLGPNLTLETAINPDFGQVEADPAEVNLTAFETRFPEKRPFFRRGRAAVQHRPSRTSITRAASARGRSGRRPATTSTIPTPNTILGAAKLTGRLQSKTSIGFHRRRHRRRRGARRHRGPRRARATSTWRRTPITSSAACCRSSGRRPRPPASSSTTCIAISKRAARSPISTRAMRLRVGGNTLLRFKGGQYEFRASGGGSFLNGSREGGRALAAIELALRAASRSRLFAARSDADLAGRLVGADELRQDRRPPLAVGRQHQDRFREFRGQRHRAAERRRRLAEERQHPLPRDAAGQGVPQLLRAARCARPTRRCAADADRPRLRGTVNVTWLNFWTSQVQVSRDLRDRPACR